MMPMAVNMPVGQFLIRGMAQPDYRYIKGQLLPCQRVIEIQFGSRFSH